MTSNVFNWKQRKWGEISHNSFPYFSTINLNELYLNFQCRALVVVTLWCETFCIKVDFERVTLIDSKWCFHFINSHFKTARKITRRGGVIRSWRGWKKSLVKASFYNWIRLLNVLLKWSEQKFTICGQLFVTIFIKNIPESVTHFK